MVEIRYNKQVVVKELKVKVDLTKYIEEHAFNFDLMLIMSKYICKL